MKEAIGGISLFQIVIVFILVFTAVICLTINHSKAFGVKDEIITRMETASIADFNNGKVFADISEYLKNAGYRTEGKCPSGNWQGYTRDGKKTSNKAAFCIRANDVASAFDKSEICKNKNCIVATGGYPTMVYYDIVLFYQLDIPIVGDAMDFKLYGSTKVIYG